MVKTIAKEAGIVILLIIAVALVLGILFYDYIPTNKTTPAKIEEYAFPEEIENELGKNGIEKQNIIRTYYIDSTELGAYEKTNNYDKGKANPFADYTTNSLSISNTTNNNNVNNNQDINGVDDVENTAEPEKFFNTSGK